MPIVVSDASPLHYFILIGEVDLLPALYGSVLLPQAVAEELRRPQTPAANPRLVVTFARLARDRRTRSTGRAGTMGGILLAALAYLGEGEREAIMLALDKCANFLLIDDREGVEQARRFGLTVTAHWVFWSGPQSAP